MLEQLQFTVSSLGKHGSAEGLHDLLDGHGLVGELIFGRTVDGVRAQTAAGWAKSLYQTSPKAPMPTGCKSVYRLVISNVVPKIWARTN